VSAAERSEARRRRVTTLALIAAAFAAVAAITVAIESRTLRQDTVSGPAIPGLADRITRAKSIVVQSPDATYRIEETDRGWAMRDRGDYPVTRLRLEQLTKGLVELVHTRRMTSDAALHARLGVDDPATGGRGVHVQILDADGAYLANVILGLQPQTLYVRAPDDDQVWAAKGELPPLQQPAAWLDLRPVALDAARIQRVEIAPHEGRAYVLAREEAGFAIVAPGRLAPRSQAILLTAAEKMTRLNASDVQAAPAIQGTRYAAVRAFTDNGVRVDGELIEADGKIWVKFTAAAANPEAQPAAAAINTGSSAWAFALSSREADSLAPTLASLLPREGGAP
jgi:hypothetical protein